MLIERERPVDEDYSAQPCQMAKSWLGRKSAITFKSLSRQLLMAADIEGTIHYNECYRSVDNYLSCKYDNWKVIWSLICSTNILATCIGKRHSDTVTAPFWNWASTDRQWFLGFHLGQPIWRSVENIQKWSIGCLLKQKQLQHAPCPIMTTSINGALTISGVASW